MQVRYNGMIKEYLKIDFKYTIFMIRALINIFLLNLIFTATLNSQTIEFVIKSQERSFEVKKFSRYHYAAFDLQNPTTFTLISKLKIDKVEISPLNEKIQFILKENRVVFTLSKPGYSLIRINDTIKVFILADKPEKMPVGEIINIVRNYGVDSTGKTVETSKIQKALNEISGTGKILYFPPGRYTSGQLKIPGNSKIHIPRGTVLNADTSSNNSYFSTDNLETKRFLYFNEAENIEISGYGTINGNGNYLRSRFGDDARTRLILGAKSRNIHISGITLQDPGSWNTQVILCEDIIFTNVKLLNNIDLANTDGFDPDASKRVLIENCFAYCGDDNVAVKATNYSGLLGDVDGVTIKGCVFLTKKSSLKVGTETRCENMRNIIFENNDVLECDRGMALYVSDGATLDNIIFRNNRFERNYSDAQKKGIHFVVSKRNPDSKLGSINNVLIKDCSFLGPFPKKSLIKHEGTSVGINVIIDNLIIGGKKVETFEEAGIERINANVSFK
ncbi:MAG: glycoside hydrolase [Bacteroidales bacterium]|nr:glycoside hydrolase [Bacteroidales bacterium]